MEANNVPSVAVPIVTVFEGEVSVSHIAGGALSFVIMLLRAAVTVRYR